MQWWRPRARAVAAVCSNRSVMHISTLAVAFLRPIWSMGPFDLPGGPNTNVSSPLANQVHSMTLCAMQVVRGRRANGSGHGAVHGAALCSPTSKLDTLICKITVKWFARIRVCDDQDGD